MSDFQKESALAQTIYAELCQIDGVGEFLDSMSEKLTERVIDDIKETLALYGHMLAPESESQKQEEDPENLSFTSACELDGPKNPEYVKGWEAAMDAVCASVGNAEPTINHGLLSVAREMLDARGRVVETETMARWRKVVERASKLEEPDRCHLCDGTGDIHT